MWYNQMAIFAKKKFQPLVFNGGGISKNYNGALPERQKIDDR